MSKRVVTWGGFLLVLFLLALAAILLSLSMGTFEIDLLDIPTYLSKKSGMEYAVLKNIRIPRTILAFSIGGALSIAGAILQGLFRNPLVEPYTMGISGGAALGVAIVIVFGLQFTFGILALPVAGFIGALITVFVVYFLSQQNNSLSMQRMLLIGVMISFVSSSAMMFLLSLTTSENLNSIVFWIMGSLDEPNPVLIYIVMVSSLLGLLVAYFYVVPLNALRLGDAKARHLGINTTTTVRVLFVLSSLLTGICVSVAGVIGFVGLLIPHLIRSMVGSDFRILLISSFLGGGIFLIVSDVIARTIIAPNELPVGVITGMLGGAVFIFILRSTYLKK